MTFISWWKRRRVFIFVMISLVIILVIGMTNQHASGGMSSLETLEIPFIPYHARNTSPETTPSIVSYDSRGETVCRETAEKYFNKPFPKQRPLFLLNCITQKPLELDCYNEELGIAIEYNGRQHYEYTPMFHKSVDSFRNQQYRDYMKKELCKKNNVVLISVPYTVPIHSIPNYLETKFINILQK